MFVKYKCNCVVDTKEVSALAVKCAQHGENIKDWSSNFQHQYRVVIHWHEGETGFALHKVSYDDHGFAATVSTKPVTKIFATTAELSAEARKMGLSMEEVSDIFYDRYIEFREFFNDGSEAEQAASDQ